MFFIRGYCVLFCFEFGVEFEGFSKFFWCFDSVLIFDFEVYDCFIFGCEVCFFE